MPEEKNRSNMKFNCIRLQEEKLDVQQALNFVTDEKAGAISSFIGTTRDNFQGY